MDPILIFDTLIPVGFLALYSLYSELTYTHKHTHIHTAAVPTLLFSAASQEKKSCHCHMIASLY